MKRWTLTFLVLLASCKSGDDVSDIATTSSKPSNKSSTKSSSSGASCVGDDNNRYKHGFVSNDYDGVYTCQNGKWVAGNKSTSNSSDSSQVSTSNKSSKVSSNSSSSGAGCKGDDKQTYKHGYVSVDYDGTYTCLNGKWVSGNQSAQANTSKSNTSSTVSKPQSNTNKTKKTSSSGTGCKGDDNVTYNNGFVSVDYDGTYTCVNGSWVSGNKSTASASSGWNTKSNSISSTGGRGCLGDDGATYNNGYVSNDYDGTYTCVNGSWQ